MEFTSAQIDCAWVYHGYVYRRHALQHLRMEKAKKERRERLKRQWNELKFRIKQTIKLLTR